MKLRNLVFIGLFGMGLLCSAGAQAASPLGKILVVLPAATTLSTREGKLHRTGYFLSELIVPLRVLIEAGIEPVFATPGGVVPTVDPISDDAKWFASAEEYAAGKKLLADLPGLSRPRALESLNPRAIDGFDGIFVPGGHAAMEDFPKNESFGRILARFQAQEKPTALICHGPAALLSARKADGTWLYAGYDMTVFSTAEEKLEEDAGALDGHVLFYVQDELERLGGLVQVKAPWSSNVVKDRELITAQNPMSDKALASVFLQSLIERIWNERLNSQAREIDPQAFSTAPENVTTIFLGRKKSQFQGDFAERLESHTRLVRSAMGKALLSYKVFSNDQFEVAVMTWQSAKAKDEAFAKSGKRVVADADEFLKNLLFVEI